MAESERPPGADDELRAWLITKTKERVRQLEELGDDDTNCARDRISAYGGARNECKLLLEIDKHVGPLDRVKIAEMVKRAEEAAKRIHGGRPRRIETPGSTGTPGVTH